MLGSADRDAVVLAMHTGRLPKPARSYLVELSSEPEAMSKPSAPYIRAITPICLPGKFVGISRW
jgi:hypothetical protein